MILTFSIPAFLLSEMMKGFAYGFIGAYIIPFSILFVWGEIRSRKQRREYMESQYGPNWRDLEHRMKVDAEAYRKNQEEFADFNRKFYDMDD